MSYSIDYRRRVVDFVAEGGRKAEALRVFKISPDTLYKWLRAGENLAPRPAKTRVRKLDKAALAAHVEKYPDAILRERAAHFGVAPNAIWVALRTMKIVKKTASLSRARQYEKGRVHGRS